jgi:UDP-galactopyranose mutase
MRVKIVGCGLAGITAAVLLSRNGHEVEIFETRNHIGGNCYDSKLAGTLMHNYGPHIFHTDDEEVFKFLSEFTEWTPFALKPLGNTKLGLVSLPYSKKTIREIGRELTQEEIVRFLFKDYSEKQWGVPFSQIPKSITNRIPKTKDCEDPTWFEGQKYQYIPKDGYTEMMLRMLYGIRVNKDCKKTDWQKSPADLTIYTGKIDEYFHYCFGELPYRSLQFIHRTTTQKLPTFIINQNTRNVPYTRIYDHSFFTPGHVGTTIITEEYPKECEAGEVPFYPMPFGEGLKTYSKYKELADKEKNVVFLGRLATYTYMDMWVVIKQAMLKVDALLS